MSTGLARKSTMLSGKMTPLVEAIELHEEPWLCPYLARQLSDTEIWTAHGGVNPCGLFVRREESKAKNSKVAHEYAEHREHGEFILVRASGE
jgi:hypothetical protein